jgi:carbon-monoxide dehydrogenase medium subunit
MTIASFDYAAPDSLKDALDLLAMDGSSALAGGQALLVAMKAHEATPSLLVDLRKITDLRGVRRQDGIVRIGAMNSLANIAQNAAVPAALADAAMAVADPHVRNQATLGGNIATAELGTDLQSALLALGAQVNLANSRTVPFGEHLSDDRGLLLASVDVPVLQAGEACAYARFSARPGRFPLCSVAVWIRRAEDTITHCRVATSAMADPARRLTELESAFIGIRATPAAVRVAAQNLSEYTFSANPFSSPAYRAHLTRVLIGRIFDVIAAEPA